MSSYTSYSSHPESRRLRNRVIQDVDWSTRHWSSYLNEYSRHARPMETYRSFVSEVFSPAQRLMRSASLSRTSSYEDLSYDHGALRRSSSYTSLAPSQAIPFRERSVERYVPTYAAYTPKTQDWRDENLNLQKLSSFRNFLAEKRIKPRTYHSSYGSYSPSTHIYTPPTQKYQTLDRNMKWPTNFTKPTTLPRWQYLTTYEQAKWRGVERGSAFLYPNYDLDDDRRMKRIYSSTSHLDAPYVLRKFLGSYYQWSPSSVTMVYSNRDTIKYPTRYGYRRYM